MTENTKDAPQGADYQPEKTAAAIREEAVLDFWQKNSIFEKSLQKDAPKGTVVFYDGPPYATGQPHYGHMLPSTIKDILPRFKTMQGYRVPRRWGWDCHGLPIENLIEKELNLKSKKDIEEYGIDKFNKAAKDSVFRYDLDWKRIVNRVGRWADMDNDYHTMDTSYTESVWWSFKTLNDKGFVYESYKVMPFCPRCQTALSNFEVNQGYVDIADISAYAKFESADEAGTFYIAWTTTPWTLPGNAALAVHPELEYSLLDMGEYKAWIATSLIAKLKEKKIIPEGEQSVVRTAKGTELAGKSYKPVFDFYTAPGTLDTDQEKNRENGWKIQTAEFVTAEDGTGIVHIAPAFGDDDMKLAKEKNLPIIQHVAQDGVIKPGNGDLSGHVAKPKDDHQKTDVEVIKYLAHAGLLFAKEKITHPYPHCWRCATPLLNYATSSWFVEVTKLRDKLVAENNKINWVPKEIGEGRFGKWLEGARDWAVSRTRYWGAPLPVWKGEKTGAIEFIGSLADLKSKIKGNGNTIMVMRHGESFSNTENVINGSEALLDKYPLTDKGKNEVAVTAGVLQAKEIALGKKVTAIYASDFARTKETAELMAEALGFDKSKIVYDKRIREINAGDFDGGTWGARYEFFQNFKERLFKKVPNGESVADVKKRATEFLYEMDAKHKDEHILVVTHGLPLRLMIDSANGKTMRDYLRSGWRDISDATASLRECDFKPLPHNDDFEIDIHRPYIDGITWTNEEGDTMRRVPDVFDVWYDSGSMPFAQQHYPFENKDLFEQDGGPLFPADFIAEGLDQTRGWFYSLLVLSVGLFDKAPYKNVTVNGLILAEDGRKMSKSLRNYPDLEPTLEKYGADSLRYLLAASPATHAEDMLFSEKGLDEVNKKFFNRFENVYSFYELYADKNNPLTGDANPGSEHVLDRWITARLASLKDDIETNLNAYLIDKAARPIMDFVDDLSTWYLRRSRDRFKGDDAADKNAAVATTRWVLIEASKLIAPFTPFMAEHMYQKLRSDDMAESVHLCAWPELGAADEQLITMMKETRKLVETGLALRSKAGVKVRQPLASFTYDGATIALDAEMSGIVADELNVKDVQKGGEIKLDTEITEELKEEGIVRDVIRSVQDMRKNAGLMPGDPITLSFEAEDAIKNILTKYEEMLKKPVLATAVTYGALAEENITTIALDGGEIRATLVRA